MTTHITENDKKINSVIFKAGAEGALIGLAGGLAAVAIGNRFSPVFKGFTIQFKAFLVSAGELLVNNLENSLLILFFSCYLFFRY
jgi:hypothetical protein